MTLRGALLLGIALPLVAPLAGCGSCSGAEGEASPTGSAETGSLVAPEPWTMGAMRQGGGLVLPPPCMARGDPLRTVLPRDTRIASEPSTLGQLLAAVGGEAHMRAGARPDHWQHDAAGLLTMTHGRTPVRPLPWPDHGTPLSARAGADRWLLALDRADDRGGQTAYLWRDGELERLGASPPLGLAALRCVEQHCALLSSRLDPESGSALEASSGATLWLGEASEPAASWQRVDLPASGERRAAPHTIASMSVRSGALTSVVVTLVDDVSVHFLAVRPGEPARPLASMPVPHGVLDAIAHPLPAVLTPLGGMEPRQCEEAGGGVTLVRAEGEPVTLRSTTSPRQGALHALDNGLLVTWLAPARCGSPRQRLHAVVLHQGDAAVAPVTIVGEADGYAAASIGRDVDLWVRQSAHDDPEAASQAGTVSWLPARCLLPPGR